MTTPQDPLTEVHALFGLASASTERIQSGRFNEHWRVNAAGQSFVLRRYNAQRTRGAIAFEHGILDALTTTEWPVAAPMRSVDGERVVGHEQRLYALFPHRPGGRGPAHDLAHLEQKGGFLARLHETLATMDCDEQREGFGRAWELDRPGATFNELLRAFGRSHHDLAPVIRAQRYRNLRELSKLGYGDLPSQVIHGDFTGENLLFADGALTGVLDFDHARVDARAVDLAWSILSDCYEPPEDTAIAIEAARSYVSGYAAVAPLYEEEARLVVPLIRAHNLAILRDALERWANEGSSDELMFRIERRVRRRLPQLDERAQAIEAAMLQATR